MPISYTIDTGRKIVRTHSVGVITDEELLAHKAELTNDLAFCPTMIQICDCRDIERFDATTDGIRAMVAHDQANAQRRNGHRVACVVACDEMFGMARMYAQRSEGGPQQVGAFRSMTDAEVWLASGAGHRTTGSN